MAATEGGMGRDRAQRQLITKTARSPIPAERRLASAIPLVGKDRTAFRRALLRWYDQHRRDLPWRKTRDPYRIWLSEIMLQQTRVAAVLEHYRVFLERFRDVEALAAAPEDAVLAAWSGLGYYRRARMLHRCAKEVTQKYDGHFPRNADALRELPGIGRYTAAAIASIAFDEPVAVVDGNVERVLQRLIGIDLTKPQIWQEAQGMHAKSRPGDSNQAMMELGATVCVPGEPRCPVCPIRKWCARPKTMEGQGAPRGQRSTSVATPQTKKEIWCLLSERKSGIRLVQRAKKASLMPGMWELPQSSQPPRPQPATAHWRTFRHSITVTNYTVHVFRNVPLSKKSFPDALPAAKGQWIAIDRIPQIPITGLTRKILKAGGII